MQIYMQGFVSNITNGKTETDEWYAQDCGVLVLYTETEVITHLKSLSYTSPYLGELFCGGTYFKYISIKYAVHI